VAFRRALPDIEAIWDSLLPERRVRDRADRAVQAYDGVEDLQDLTERVLIVARAQAVWITPRT
jgi:hypothetical protein